MIRTVDRITICALTPEMHARTCSYWYTLLSRSTSETAFRTDAALHGWLALTGLDLGGVLPPKGKHAVFQPEGSYRTEMHGEYCGFFELDAVAEIRTLSNGEYTLGLVTRDYDGVRTIHTLNPNLRRRPSFPYAESNDRIDRGNYAADWRA